MRYSRLDFQLFWESGIILLPWCGARNAGSQSGWKSSLEVLVIEIKSAHYINGFFTEDPSNREKETKMAVQPKYFDLKQFHHLGENLVDFIPCE